MCGLIYIETENNLIVYSSGLQWESINSCLEVFSLHHHIQNGSGAHPASYPVGTRVSGGKMAGA
jgi:hypothetical protein